MNGTVAYRKRLACERSAIKVVVVVVDVRTD